jgi:hypothetical protein
MANVLFKIGTKAQFQAIGTKSETTLYWLSDTQELYKGDVLFGTGALATQSAAGLLSPEDKAKLDALVAGGGLSNLIPVDNTIVIADVEGGGKSIGVAISTEAGNVLVKKNDGLYVDASGAIDVPEYAIEKQAAAEDGYAASYRLKKTVGDASSYVGDTINIPKDMVLQSATLERANAENVPYIGAAIGDPYIHMVFNDASASAIYVPVKDLADTYTAGEGIDIIGNAISVKIAAESNGLVAVDGALSINLATVNSAGAMSAADKAALDALIALNIAENYASKTDLQEVVDKATAAEESYTWGEM